MQGKYLVLEGLDGAGKSTAIEVVRQWLLAQNVAEREIITTREPGGTAIAEALRNLLKRQDTDDKMDAVTELLLMYAARVQLVKRVIQPALLQGKWVIGDRHELSTRAYQGGGRGISQHTLETLWQLSLNGFKPDLTIYLDIAPEIGLRRLPGTKDRIEAEPLAFFERVRKVYLDYVSDAANIYCVNADQNITKVHADIIKLLEQHCGVR